MEIHPEELFSGPSGWEAARISVLGSLAFFAMYGYFELLHGSGLLATLVIGVAMGLSAIAELLPTDRRRPAIVLRLSAIGILVVLVVVSLGRIVS